MPFTAIKGQVLADFVVEFTESIMDDGKGIMETMTVSVSIVATWEVYMDGATNQKGSGVGIVLVTLEKLVMEKLLHLDFLDTNNKAEYEALLA